MAGKDEEPKPSKVFKISEKTPHSWLAAVPNHWMSYTDKSQVAQDMVTNTEELESGVPWPVVFQHSKHRKGSTLYTGREAAIHTVAATVGSIANHMGWDMHSPQVVCMSGYYFAWGLGKDAAILDNRVQKIKDEEITFQTDLAREEALTKAEGESAMLWTFRRRILDSMQEYARQTFSDNPVYLKLLQNLVFITRRHVKDTVRLQILTLLKEGKIQEAATLIPQKPAETEPMEVAAGEF